MGPGDIGRIIDGTMSTVSSAIDDAIKSTKQEAAKVARAELKKTSTIVPGPDAEFSNFRRAGKLKVRIRGDATGIDVVPIGPWGIAEGGAGPHSMKAWGRGTAKHPGTRSSQAKRAWSRGQAATFQRLEREVPEHIADVVEGAFDG